MSDKMIWVWHCVLCGKPSIDPGHKCFGCHRAGPWTGERKTVPSHCLIVGGEVET